METVITKEKKKRKKITNVKRPSSKKPGARKSESFKCLLKNFTIDIKSANRKT
jgi:hypothetical protein